MLALHGLEGSSSAHYMQGIADKAWARGMNVVLLNQRNCGDTERLSAGLYHSGLTDDPAFVLRNCSTRDRLPAIVLIGYSLGGNLTLKLTGEFGREAPAQFVGACAVSPTLDLPTCIDALERPSNVLYQWNFVRNLKARMRRKDQDRPGKFDLSKLRTFCMCGIFMTPIRRRRTGSGMPPTTTTAPARVAWPPASRVQR